MKSNTQKNPDAFTLVEVMIIVALTGLLVALAIPSFLKVRRQSQGERIVNDARVIDSAIDAWASENNRTDGADIDIPQASSYTKTGSINTNDVLGNSYEFGKVNIKQVKIADTSKNVLSGVKIDWGAY